MTAANPTYTFKPTEGWFSVRGGECVGVFENEVGIYKMVAETPILQVNCW